ncbi:hypothetical protein B0H11DRAFT_1952352 [Mycena galericulata]|nr:hypothetical protein B0H11DRAFT_1952352 [Mycena galericulata]
MTRAASPAIFALIIGIDKYKADEYQFGRLKAAVNDAKLFKKFLTDAHQYGGLQVPLSQIVFLENAQATHKGILSKFQSHFLDNEDIPEHGNAAMIFFFAGHGSRIHSDGNRGATDSKVEVICPFDERSRGDDGEEVGPIPDYVLAQLLKKLADRKGNNITVVMDACNSGGMARDRENLRVRSPHIPSYISSPRVEGKAAESHRVWSPSSDSHILLAACGPEDMAYETSSHGHFTERLILAFRDAVRKGPTTYIDLIEGLPTFPVRSQIPRCIGLNQHRILFSKNEADSRLRTLLLKEVHVLILPYHWDDEVDERSTFILTSIHGTQATFTVPLVTEDYIILASAEPFDVHENSTAVEEDTGIEMDLTQKRTTQAFLIPTGSFEGVGRGVLFPIRLPNGNSMEHNLRAEVVGINQTLLFWSNYKPNEKPVYIKGLKGSRAVVTTWAEKVNIYMPQDLARWVFPFCDYRGAQRFAKADSENEADIVLTTNRDTAVITRKVGRTIEYANHAPFSLKDVSNDRLSSVIGGIAHFHFFLERRNDKSPLNQGIELKMYQLKGDYPQRAPIRPRYGDGNLIKVMPNGLRKVEIPPNKKLLYGFEICNNATDEDLFPYLFYFNPGKYLIKPFYTPPSAHDGGPLKMGGNVSVGMGGEHAFYFSLPPGLTESFGIFKLFVSTTYIDLPWIKQMQSPWRKDFQGVGRADAGREKSLRGPDWAAMEVVLEITPKCLPLQ